LWRRVKETFDADAEHLQRIFFPALGIAPLTPGDSYVRIWLSELFLAKQVQWGVERFPAVQASVRMLFGGVSPRTFATLVQPSSSGGGSGVFEDYQLTELLPYNGQAVELQAALYEILGQNNLRTAIDIVTDFASLVTPPVSSVVSVIDKVATGIEKVIQANATDPVLALHGTLAAPGGGQPNQLMPGLLAVVRATDDELPLAELHIDGSGRLSRNGQRLAGFDYLVLRIEGRRTRDDWRTPDLDSALSQAMLAKDLGRKEEYERLRADALSRIYFSADFTPVQRRQLAQTVKEELGEAAPGAVAVGDRTVASIVARRGLPSPAEVANLTVEKLLA
jgi:hypothetical protein